MSDEKPFEATPSRMERARREGNSPRSSDLCAVCAFAAGALAAGLNLSALAEAGAQALRAAAAGNGDVAAYAVIGRGTLAICCASAAAATLATIAQGGRVTFTAPALKFDRLNPAAGVRRMLSLETAAATAKAALAAVVAAAVTAPGIGDALLAAQSGGDAPRLAALIGTAVMRMAALLAAAGVVFGAVDMFVSRRSWRKRIRMTFAEFREDQKQQEGDPHVRRRQRAAHQRFVRGSIERLRDAAFVVVNPTHVAVALEYHPPEVEVPRVLIRALDAGALEVRRRAGLLEIPTIEDRALARALFERTCIDGYIPADLYTPVARIVASLLRVVARE